MKALKEAVAVPAYRKNGLYEREGRWGDQKKRRGNHFQSAGCNLETKLTCLSCDGKFFHEGKRFDHLSPNFKLESSDQNKYGSD